MRRRVGLLLSVVAVGVAIVATLVGSLIAVLGAELPCADGGGTGRLEVAPTKAAKNEIPAVRLPIYQAAAKRFDVNWAFLASIGTQECGAGTCAHVYWSGCGGPMQIAIERESACSPGSGPTIWERYGMDADGDGEANPFDLDDAIFTAARMLRPVFGLSGDSYAAYHEVACNYYGACSDGTVAYASEVMARAVAYGFRSGDIPGPAAGKGAPVSGASCRGDDSAVPTGKGPMGPVRRVTGQGHLEALPAAAAGPGEECDSRIVPDVVYLARRFGLVVTDCYGIAPHAADGEHPLGSAIDAVPRDGNWARTQSAAEALGWHSSCGLSGVAPACARPPFRFIGYNGYPGHGDPEHCLCGESAHIHLSWLSSASPGQPEYGFHYSYFPPRWIDVFAVPGGE